MNANENIKFLDWHEEVAIVLFRELREPTEDSAHTFGQYCLNLTEGKPFHMILDLSSNVIPPNAKTRAAVRNEFAQLEPQILSLQLVTGSNFLVKITVRFVTASIGMKNFEFVNDSNTAIKKIKNGSYL